MTDFIIKKLPYGNRLAPPRDFWRSMLQVIDFYGTLFAHCLKTEGGSKRLLVPTPVWR